MPKSKICIKNLIITDIPSRSNRIFLKLKSGRNSVLSNKYEIGINNEVKFNDVIIIEHDFGKSKEKLHFSFRIEKSNGIDFKRYGSFNVTDLEYNKLQPYSYHLSRNLEKCKEKPKVNCEIVLLNYPHKNQRETVTFSMNDIHNKKTDISAPVIKNIAPIKTNKNHLSDLSSNARSCPVCLCIDEDGKTCNVSTYSSSLSSSSFSKSIPLKISQEKYDELEKNVDNLLAEIINGNYQE